MRRYAEVIDVTDTGDVDVTGFSMADPHIFVWRGRRYVVRRVLARWRERRAWWRDALDPGRGRPSGMAVAERERHVWRVEASAERSAGAGVYDLACDDADDSAWHLIRVAD